MHRRFLPIKTPCNVDWNTLTARGKHRFCGECQKVVHDLSALSEAETRALFADRAGDLCVRYLYDATGTVHFADSRLVAASALARKRGAAAVLAAAPLLFQACGGADDGFLEPVLMPCIDQAENGDAGPAPDGGAAGIPTSFGVPCGPSATAPSAAASATAASSALESATPHSRPEPTAGAQDSAAPTPDQAALATTPTPTAAAPSPTAPTATPEEDVSP